MFCLKSATLLKSLQEIDLAKWLWLPFCQLFFAVNCATKLMVVVLNTYTRSANVVSAPNVIVQCIDTFVFCLTQCAYTSFWENLFKIKFAINNVPQYT